MRVTLNGPFELNGRQYQDGETVDDLPVFVAERLVLHGQAVGSDEVAAEPVAAPVEPVVTEPVVVEPAVAPAQGGVPNE